MCVSLAEAHFSDTRVMLNRTLHPVDGRVIDVLGYQNNAVSFAGPNAMLIHIPTNVPLTRDNFLDMTGCPNVLKDMQRAITPPATLGGSRGLSYSVDVFDIGNYTVVSARHASDLYEALSRVPADRRPQLRRNLFDAYNDRMRTGWSFALACFNNEDQAEMEPFFVWYYSSEDDYRLPALDAHTGNAPTDGYVDTDHTLILAHYEMTTGFPVRYRDILPDHVLPFLPRLVVGQTVDQRLPNGDFIYRSEDVRAGEEVAFRRDMPRSY